MNSNLPRKGLAVVTAAVTTVLVVAGCATEQETRLAEPALDFPYTSITAAPPPLSLDDLEEDEEENPDGDGSETSETESSSSTTSTTRTTSSSHTSRANASEDTSDNSGGGGLSLIHI